MKATNWLKFSRRVHAALRRTARPVFYRVGSEFSTDGPSCARITVDDTERGKLLVLEVSLAELPVLIGDLAAVQGQYLEFIAKSPKPDLTAPAPSPGT